MLAGEQGRFPDPLRLQDPDSFLDQRFRKAVHPCQGDLGEQQLLDLGGCQQRRRLIVHFQRAFPGHVKRIRPEDSFGEMETSLSLEKPTATKEA